MKFVLTVIESLDCRTQAALTITEEVIARGYLTTILFSIKCRVRAI